MPATARERRARRYLIQSFTYLAAGVAVMAFVTLVLAPRAAVERRRMKPVTNAGSQEAPVVPAPSVSSNGTGGSGSDASPDAKVGEEPAGIVDASPSEVVAKPEQPQLPAPAKPDTGSVPSPVVLRYAIGVARPNPGDLAMVAKVAHQLTRDESLHVEITGHTDQRGDVNENVALSKLRATTLADLLVARGIQRTRITTEGVGSTRPVEANESSEARANNRRTEVVFVRAE